jgi:biopolymer transport protein ExbB
MIFTKTDAKLRRRAERATRMLATASAWIAPVVARAQDSAGSAAPPAPAVVPGAAVSPASPSIGAGLLPQDLSPWGMFLNADVVVKAVIIALALASLVTWTVWLAKSIELFGAKRKTRKGLHALGEARMLAEADQQVRGKRSAVARLVAAAGKEVVASANLPGDGVKERVGWRLERIEAGIGRKMSRGTGVLATIGATAPFVGLFGTVWGIMNSFIGISKAHTTNLAVVAPGIAEALLATAFGLAAAIPAVVIYNAFARSIGGYRAMLADASAEVMRLVSRDLDRRESPLSRAAE